MNVADFFSGDVTFQHFKDLLDISFVRAQPRLDLIQNVLLFGELDGKLLNIALPSVLLQ